MRYDEPQLREATQFAWLCSFIQLAYTIIGLSAEAYRVYSTRIPGSLTMYFLLAICQLSWALWGTYHRPRLLPVIVSNGCGLFFACLILAISFIVRN